MFPLAATAQNAADQGTCIAVVEAATADPVDYAATVELLRQFGPTCENNVEFQQWGNEVLMGILLTHPLLVIRGLKAKDVDESRVLKQLRNPLLDHPLDSVITRVANLPESTQRDSVLAALKFAAVRLD
ncbi:MAG: hypothetical protein AAGJ10_00505 [Bacteroidota bacterium]